MSGPIIMQIILTLLALLGVQKIVARVRRRSTGAALSSFWIFGTIIFLIFVWNPAFATRISELLGVGRGVDAAVYIAVALLFYIALRILIRLEQQENLITKLVSEIALLRDQIKKK